MGGPISGGFPPLAKSQSRRSRRSSFLLRRRNFLKMCCRCVFTRLIDNAEYSGDLVIALAHTDQCQDLLLTARSASPTDPGRRVPGDLSLAGIGPSDKTSSQGGPCAVGALTEARDESGIQREKARFFSLFFPGSGEGEAARRKT